MNGKVIMKTGLCIILSLIFISGSLCGCNFSGKAEPQTYETSISSTLNDSYADFSDQNDAAGTDGADDLSRLTELGIIDIVKNSLIWENFIKGVYSEFNNSYKEVINVGDKYYCEMIITWEDISGLENAFGEKLVPGETGEYYECPFNTLSELKDRAKKYLPDDKLEELISSGFMIEKDDHLYILFAGPNFRDYNIISADILHQTDNEIRFAVTFTHKYGLDENIYTRSEYTVGKIGEDWVMTDRSR